MKKIFLLSIILCLFLMSGCAPRIRDNSLIAVEISPAIKAVPVIADLQVSETKVRGEAAGATDNIAGLRQEAITNALGHNPPSADRPDVLIGTTFFYEFRGNAVSVMATGYPAFFTNFRSATENDVPFLSIHTPNRSEATEFQTAQSGGSEVYLSLKWQPTAPYSGAGGNFEIGRFRGNRYFGVDFGGGKDNFGGGLSWGGRIQPVDWFQATFGGSAGNWALFTRQWDRWDRYYYNRLDFAFGGPFVKTMFGNGKVWGEFNSRWLFGTSFAYQPMLGVSFTF